METTQFVNRSMPLPAWMRATLWTTAVLNAFGAIAFFMPALPLGRSLMGLPTTHPLYLWVVAEFIFLMGLAYGYCAWSGQAPRFFLLMGAVGKLAFSMTLISFWLIGHLPLQTPLLGGADFILGMLFVIWLIQTSRS